MNTPKSPKRTLLFFLFPAFIALVAVFLAGFIGNRQENGRISGPVYEVYPVEKQTNLNTDGFSHRGKKPEVAIIIDDMGYAGPVSDHFVDLPGVFTYSVLPESPFRKSVVKKIRARGKEMMLHLPMEPMEYPMVDPGPGALLVRMNEKELIRLLESHIADIPGIVGVNNHMGSRLTTLSSRMTVILSRLKKKNLFFVDSYTSAGSVCRSTARLIGIPFARRDVFLDHVLEKNFIRAQVEKLILTALNYGEAVGICHPHQITLEVIRSMLPELKEKVILVPASEIVHVTG